MSGSVSYELFKTKDLLESIAIPGPTVAQGAAIPFDINTVLLGNGITHTPGSTEFNLITPGYYQIIFTGFVGNANVNNYASVGLMINNAIVQGTTINSLISGLNSVASFTTQTIAQVLPNVVSVLKVINLTATSATFATANIVIQKIS